MIVENHTGRGRKQRELMPEQRKGWCLHRILLGTDPALCDAATIAEAFADTSPFAAGSYTGGKKPYSIAALPGGVLQQMLELCEYGPHALDRWSTDLVGVAAVGDFRRHEPPAAQLEALADVCAVLAVWTGDAEGIGHTALPRDWGDKECPGHLLSMTALRAMVAERMPAAWRKWSPLACERYVLDAGLVI